MKNNIFDLLRAKGYLKGKEVNINRIASTSPSEIIDISKQISASTKVDRIVHNSSFVFSASSSLSGDSHPCAMLKCREESALRLAQFSALYSDQIYIPNYLSRFDNLTKKSLYDEQGIRYSFFADIKVLSLLEPLIKASLIVPYCEPSYCPICDEEKGLSEKSRKKYNRECTRLEKESLNKISAKAVFHHEMYWLEVSGPDNLIPHGFTALPYRNLPGSNTSTLERRLRRGERISLSKSEILKLKIPSTITSSIIHDIPLQLFSSQIFNTSFLTDQEKQIEILNSMYADTARARRNAIIEEHLTSFVPFLKDVDLKDLLKIRKREGDSFLLFRQSLNRAINEYKDSSLNFTEKNARELYSDIVAPQLAKLDLKIASAKRDLIKSTSRKTIGWVGAISFGLYSRVIPTDLAIAAASLGIVKTAAEWLEMMMTKSDAKENIKNEDMYFLWKVRQVAGKRKKRN